MTTSRGMMGFDNPGDKKVPISVRDWNAMKLAMWRSKRAFEIAERSAIDILMRCQHSDGCPAESEKKQHVPNIYLPEPCLRDCPDREVRMSALVVLNAARTCSPEQAVKVAEGSYYAPSREYFSEVLVDYEVTKMENVALREALRRANVIIPSPVEELTPKELVSKGEAQ